MQHFEEPVVAKGGVTVFTTEHAAVWANLIAAVPAEIGDRLAALREIADVAGVAQYGDGRPEAIVVGQRRSAAAMLRIALFWSAPNVLAGDGSRPSAQRNSKTSAVMPSVEATTRRRRHLLVGREENRFATASPPPNARDCRQSPAQPTTATGLLMTVAAALLMTSMTASGWDSIGT